MAHLINFDELKDLARDIKKIAKLKLIKTNIITNLLHLFIKRYLFQHFNSSKK